jgi:hypothetical protein
MKTDYPYYVAVKIDAGKLVKIYKDKKYKTYTECYDKLMHWLQVYFNCYMNGQYAILKYTSHYDCKIVTIFTDTIETNLIKLT